MGKLNIGDKIIDFKLPGTDGKSYSLEDFKDKKAVVVIFTCNHCPYVLAWEDRMINIGNEFKDKNVGFMLICSNDAEKYPADSFEKMKERSEIKNYPFPYLHDENQKTASEYGAKRTPEIFLFDSVQRLVYHGAVDDNYEEPEKVKSHYLKDALFAVLSRESVSIQETPPIGCTIKWK